MGGLEMVGARKPCHIEVGNYIGAWGCQNGTRGPWVEVEGGWGVGSVFKGEKAMGRCYRRGAAGASGGDLVAPRRDTGPLGSPGPLEL